MIPPEIRDFETYIVAYSGGKDSTATLLWALDNLPRECVRAVFCDTGAEWPETYDYLDYVEHEIEFKIERIKAGDIPLPPRVDGKERQDAMHNGQSLFELVHLRGKWPGARYRFCTTYLKRWPLRLYAAECAIPNITDFYDDSNLASRLQTAKPVLQIDGCRADESKTRANYPWLDESSNNNVSSPFLPSTPPICHPIIKWSERDIWEFLRAHDILPNPIYNHAGRCGCWCCIMAKKQEILNFCRLHPDIAQKAADLEQEINHMWTSRQSITNLLRQAQVQMQLFKPQPRFAEVAE